MKVVIQTTANGQTTSTTHTLDFTYDASGSPVAVTYDGTTCYYATNLQGDVVAILNGSGSTVVSYTYDAWGYEKSCTGTMASTLGHYNPLRYRGYVCDAETKLYYLQSRYYDPAIGRFLNADAFASTGQGLLGNNMFAYCRNNPVSRTDIPGTFDEEFLDCTPNLDEEKIMGKSSVGEGKNTSNNVNGNGPRLTYLGGNAAPNPGGRHGGILHREMVAGIKALLRALGFEVYPTEKRVYYNDQGNYRYSDVTATKDETTVYIQVGRSTSGGNPVAREAYAKADLEKTNCPVYFVPYDK